MIDIISRIKQKIRIRPYFKVNGEKTLRINYDELNENSTVMDVGGYEGQWSSDIFSKYMCKIHIFEPVPNFAKSIKDRFKKNNKIIVHDKGLSSITVKRKITLNKDASSLIKNLRNSTEIELLDIKEFFEKNDIKKIDLIKINIEGAEYDLLDRMIETNLQLKMKNIQVQFHDFFPEAKKRMEKIQKELSKTHQLTYQFPFVWENWEKID